MTGIDYSDLPMYRGALADAVGFTPDDLDANRSGRMSRSQRALLMRDERRRVGFVGLCIVAAAASLLIALSLGLANLKGIEGWALSAFFVIAAGIGSCRPKKRGAMSAPESCPRSRASCDRP